MKEAYHKLRVFFPGKKFNLLILNVVGLFTVSLFEMLGVAAVLPIVNLAMGAPIEGYLKQVAELFGNPDRTALIIIFGVVLVLAFILKGAFSLIIKRWSLGFVATQQSTTSVNLLNRYMREPYLAHRKRGTANILSSINDYAHQAYAAFVNGVINFIGELLSITVLMVMLLAIMPIPALLAFSYFGLVAYGLQHILRKKNREQAAGSCPAPAARCSIPSPESDTCECRPPWATGAASSRPALPESAGAAGHPASWPAARAPSPVQCAEPGLLPSDVPAPEIG